MIANSISSLVFSSNTIMLWLAHQPLYAALMGILTLTSVWNHYVETTASALIDKIAVYAVVIYGAYHYFAYTVHYKQTIFALFIASGFIYYVVLPQTVDPQTYVLVHGALHFIASM